MRTSHTHPLQIAELPCPGGGMLGVTFCPGKWQSAAATGAWSRDLAVDVQAIGAWGAALVITLVTNEELHALSVPELGQAVEEAGMGWHHLPIEDVSVPSATWEKAWPSHRDVVHATFDRGGRVLVHCKGGLGRAGLIAARILVERGLAPDAALAAVRGARRGAVETAAQERYVLGLSKRSQAMASAEIPKRATLEVACWWIDDGTISFVVPDVQGSLVKIGDNPRRVNGHPVLHYILGRCLHFAGVGAPRPEKGSADAQGI